MPGRHNNDVFKKGWTTMYKNIDKQTKLTLKELVEYQEGQVVSKTLVQNDIYPCSRRRCHGDRSGRQGQIYRGR